MFSTFNEGPLFHVVTCYKKLNAFHLVILKCLTYAVTTLFVIMLHSLICNLYIFSFFSVEENIENSIYILIKK